MDGAVIGEDEGTLGVEHGKGVVDDRLFLARMREDLVVVTVDGVGLPILVVVLVDVSPQRSARLGPSASLFANIGEGKPSFVALGEVVEAVGADGTKEILVALCPSAVDAGMGEEHLLAAYRCVKRYLEHAVAILEDSLDGMEMPFRLAAAGSSASEDLVEVVRVVVADQEDRLTRQIRAEEYVVEMLPVDDGLALIDAFGGIRIEIIA